MVVNVGYRKQLLFDDHLIGEMEDIRRRAGQAVKYEANPIMSVDKPWEGTRLNAGPGMYDEDEQVFKMWYYCADERSKSPKEGCCLAVSRDGVNWEKPSINIVEYDGSTSNNLIPIPKPYRAISVCSIFKSTREPDLDKRYKAFITLHPAEGMGGLYVAFSPDGLRFKAVNEKPSVAWGRGLYKIRDRTGTSYTKIWADPGPVVYDEETRRFMLYPVYLVPITGVGYVEADNSAGWKRIQGMRTSRDGLDWSEPAKIILEPDDRDQPYDQFYGISVYRYEDVYLGIVGVYHVWDGTMESQVAFSRDGEEWIRPDDRTPLIPFGLEGAWDGKMIQSGGISMFRIGDEIYLYYTGHRFVHHHWRTGEPFASSIGLAKLRLDGFVYIEANDEWGTLTTKPLAFTGTSLELNVDSLKGSLKVEILDVYGSRIPGFSEEDCDPINSDSVHHTVTWKGDSSLSCIDGWTVHLRFHLKNAKLYAFQFKEKSQ